MSSQRGQAGLLFHPSLDSVAEMAEKLKHPPVVEAVFELRLEPSGGWDWTIPGRLYERFKSDFSERSEALSLTAIPTTPEQLREFQKVQMRRPDGTAMIQTGLHMLAVNQMKPYPGWEHFKGLILDVLEAFLKLGPRLQPARLGLRYINMIGPLAPEGDLSSILRILPRLQGPLKRKSASFYQRQELIYDDPDGVLNLQSGLGGRGDTAQVVLDLDFGSTTESLKSMTTTAAGVGEWLERAHSVVGEAFRAALTQEMYNQLRG